jgi:methyl-accepting chemotaxis protein
VRLQPLFALGGFLVAVCAIVMAIGQLTGFSDWPEAPELFQEWLVTFRARGYDVGSTQADGVRAAYDVRAAQGRVQQMISTLQAAEDARWRQNPTDVGEMTWAPAHLRGLIDGLGDRPEPPPGCEDPFQSPGVRRFGFAKPFLKNFTNKKVMTAYGPPNNIQKPKADEDPSVPEAEEIANLTELPAPYTFLYCTEANVFKGQFRGRDGSLYGVAVTYVAAINSYEAPPKPPPPDYVSSVAFSCLLALAGMVMLSLLLTRSVADSARSVHRAREQGISNFELPGGFITEVQEIAEGVNGMTVLLASTVTRITTVQEFARSLSENLRRFSSQLTDQMRRQRGAGDAARDAHERLRRGVAGLTHLAASVGREARAVLAESKLLAEKFVGSSSRVQGVQAAHANLVQFCRKMYRLSQGSVAEVEEGKRAVERSLASLKAINGSVEAIGERVDKISEIAEQTNLLALNAAIQAASGGEKGKSFALVAEEVRKLADLSADTTKEIVLQVQSTLEQISDGQQTHSEVFAVLSRMSDNASELDRTLVATANALDSLDKDMAVIGDLCQRVTEVAPVLVRASEAQQKAVNELTGHSEALASSDAELAKFMAILGDLAEKTGKEAFELDRITRDLMGHAESLKNTVADLQEG